MISVLTATLAAKRAEHSPYVFMAAKEVCSDSKVVRFARTVGQRVSLHLVDMHKPA